MIKTRFKYGATLLYVALLAISLSAPVAFAGDIDTDALKEWLETVRTVN